MLKFKILVAILLFFLFPSSIHAASTYYVSNSGSDSNNGTSSNLPWKTIAKINSTSFIPGDDILFKRGDSWNEVLLAPYSGTTDLPILYSVYGTGPMPIIDGSGLYPSHTGGSGMIKINGSYVIIENIEVKNAPIWGVNISYGPPASHVTLRDLNVHDTWFSGIQDNGSYDLIENNSVWHTSLNHHVNPADDYDGGVVIGDTGTPYLGMNSTVRNNKVYQTYGEGILIQYTDNTLVEGNRVWDNLAPAIYPDSGSFVTIRNNFIYHTPNTEFWALVSPTRPGTGIFISDENIIAGHPVGHDRKIYNNIVVNCTYGFSFSGHNTDHAALINDTVVNNTFVNPDSAWRASAFHIGAPPTTGHSGTVIENNLVFAPYGNTGDIVGPLTGLSLSNNLWYGTQDSSLVGANVLTSDPKLANSGQIIELDQIAYPLDVSAYMLISSSPAINKALALVSVTTDYFGTSRGSLPDIGAHEFVTILVGDINHDGVVNIQDFTLLSNAFGTNNAATDINSDGIVNVQDYILLSNNFGKTS